MKIQISSSALRQTRWSEYAIRFLFGGIVTVMAGLIAKAAGPVFGGLFLAFPAIFPATATLIEKHEKEKKHRAGLHGRKRGRDAAGTDAAGAAMGSIGLAVFGATTWMLLPDHPAWQALAAATASWAVVSVAM